MRRWADKGSGYGAGQADTDIKPGGSGQLPNFLTFGIRGRGYDYYYIDDERIRYLKEVSFVSPPFKYTDGSVYRFVISYARANQNAQTARGYFMLANCLSDGTLIQEPSEDTTWDSTIGTNGQMTTGQKLYAWQESASWNDITTIYPTIELSTYNMMISDSDSMYKQIADSSFQGVEFQGISFTCIKRSVTPWNTPPLIFSKTSETAAQIVQRALSLSNHKYWYGAAGQVATQQLANSLRQSYPSIWTQSYYNEAILDIGTQVGDCSYLVNYAYGIASPGNHGPGTASYQSMYSKWEGTPKNGMIVWRNGHAGIYNNGSVIELSSLKNDFKITQYSPSNWSATLYNKNIQY